MIRLRSLSLVLFLFCASSLSASIPGTVQWDVRTTGSDTNGGGWDSTSSGTDFSQQDAAQVTYTDLVIGSGSSQVTSAAHPFTSAHLGNIINITSGTGFTTGRYVINSLSGSTAGLDRAVGTVGSTGGTGSLGGSLATVSTALNSVVGNNIVHVKAGTYTVTAVNPTIAVVLLLQGYQTTHGDRGTKPLITTATNSTRLFNLSGSNTIQFRNLSFSNTATTRASGIYALGNGVALVVSDSVLDGFTNGLDGTNGSDWAFSNGVYLFNTEIKNCTVGIINNAGIANSISLTDSYIHGNSSSAVYNSSTNGGISCLRSVLASSQYGINFSANGNMLISLINCVVANNTTQGADFSQGGNLHPLSVIENTIFYGNGGYGFGMSIPSTGYFSLLINKNNAYGGNTTGARLNLPVGLNDVALTANPFTASSSGDFSLNSTAGGGALLKAAGFPGVFPGGLSTGYLDIGAVQSQGSGGGGASTPTNYGFVR